MEKSALFKSKGKAMLFNSYWLLQHAAVLNYRSYIYKGKINFVYFISSICPFKSNRSHHGCNEIRIFRNSKVLLCCFGMHLNFLLSLYSSIFLWRLVLMFKKGPFKTEIKHIRNGVRTKSPADWSPGPVIFSARTKSLVNFCKGGQKPRSNFLG